MNKSTAKILETHLGISDASPQMALAAIQVLSSCASRSEIFLDSRGNTVNPGLNLIVVRDQPSTWDLTLSSLVRPVEDLQRRLIEISKACDPKTLQALMARNKKAATPALVNSEPGDTVRAHASSCMRAYNCLEKPLFYLRNPNRASLIAGMVSSFDDNLYLNFTTDILKLPQNNKRNIESNRLLRMLGTHFHGLSKSDTQKNTKRYCSASPVFLTGIFTTTRETIADIIARDDTAGKDMLEQCLLVEWFDNNDYSFDHKSWASAIHNLYRKKEIGFCNPAPRKIIMPKWDKFCENNSVSDCSLATKLAGNVLNALPELDKSEVKPITRLCEDLAITASKYRHQQFESIREDAITQNKEKEKNLMLRKISKESPIHFIQLRRKYDVQNRELHEPALEALKDGKLVEVEGGIISITPKGKEKAA